MASRPLASARRSRSERSTSGVIFGLAGWSIVCPLSVIGPFFASGSRASSLVERRFIGILAKTICAIGTLYSSAQSPGSLEADTFPGTQPTCSRTTVPLRRDLPTTK